MIIKSILLFIMLLWFLKALVDFLEMRRIMKNKHIDSYYSTSMSIDVETGHSYKTKKLRPLN